MPANAGSKKVSHGSSLTWPLCSHLACLQARSRRCCTGTTPEVRPGGRGQMGSETALRIARAAFTKHLSMSSISRLLRLFAPHRRLGRRAGRVRARAVRCVWRWRGSSRALTRLPKCFHCKPCCHLFPPFFLTCRAPPACPSLQPTSTASRSPPACPTTRCVLFHRRVEGPPEAAPCPRRGSGSCP